MLLFPFFMQHCPPSPDLLVRVEQLEKALALSFGLLQTLLEQLDSKLGPGFSNGGLAKASVAGAARDPRQDVARIDEMIREGQQPHAARLLRELAGITWSQAHDVIAVWESYTVEQKVRWLWLAQWVSALGGGKVPVGSAVRENEV